MKISLDWLNQYLSRPADADAVDACLTNQGFPIESREDLADGDIMLDVEITSNRGDCLSHVGLAREVSAGRRLALRPPAVAVNPASVSGDPASTLASVEVTASAGCPVYTARVIRGVRVGPSPSWLVKRLEAIGLRSVNNVVDVTNFVLMELGQPLHAFDLKRLAGSQVMVREARANEPFVAIDGSRHQLQPGMVVIADASQPVAIAGVMGGLESEVGAQTVDVLLESARFEPLSVRRTSRALKLASDSSYRFERGVDPLGVDRASLRAAQLIIELAGGALAPGVIRVGEPEPEPHTVTMRVDRCNALSGLSLTAAEIVSYLLRLDLQPQVDAASHAITCEVPSFRLDLEREVDLIEEVVRLHGFAGIPVRDRIEIHARPPQAEVTARAEMSAALVGHGYHEAITFSFVPPKLGAPFVPPGAAAVQIDDERRKAEPMLRPSLAPSLMLCRKANQDVGADDVRLFECAAIWRKDEQGQYQEHRVLTLLADAPDVQRAIRDLKGSVREVVERVAGDARLQFEPIDRPAFEAAAAVTLDDEPIGMIGLVSPVTQDLFSLQEALVVAELDATRLEQRFPPQRKVGELTRFPAIERDLSIVVSEATTWRQIAQTIDQAAPLLLESVSFQDVYRGKPIPAGQKSVSFRMRYRNPSSTLRHDEVDPQVHAVVERLKADLSAELRG